MKRDSYETNIRVALSTTHLIGVRPLYISDTSIKKRERAIALKVKSVKLYRSYLIQKNLRYFISRISLLFLLVSC
jgi:hypothetical protein